MSALTQNAKIVLERRYLLKNENGDVIESPDAMFKRVADFTASHERRDKKHWAKVFYQEMSALRFLPNSPTLMNAGKKDGQLSACFVLPIADDLDGIFTSLKNSALIHQSGGGTGFNFSNLRARGARVKSSMGVASGPVSFLRIFDVMTDTIKQGGTRRGANMGILNCDHPDLLEFINCKRDLKAITNFNLSVGITDRFMEEVVLRRPETLKKWSAILKSAWLTGDPGLVFLDRINRFNPTPKQGPMESTNPCGEQPLLAYESCNLGSIDVSKFVKGSKIDWNELGSCVETAVRFLDNIIDLNKYPIPECKKVTLSNRKIGLGIMGFADALLLLDLPYDSIEARTLGEKFASFIDLNAKRASRQLAKKRGAFQKFKGSLWDRLGYPIQRNATVSTVAPTGTISIIAGCSSGIEPIFSARYTRNVLSGERLVEFHPSVQTALLKKGYKNLESLTEDQIESNLGRSYLPAHKIAVIDHVKMQAVFQRHSDSAVSKTINLPNHATESDIDQAYQTAYAMGCKGITIYRDQSRDAQVLEQVLEKRVCEVCID